MAEVDRLLTLKKKIKDKQDEKSRLQGRLDQLMSQLKEEFGCSSVEEGKAKLGELEAEVKNLQSQVTASTAEIERKYEQLSK